MDAPDQQPADTPAAGAGSGNGRVYPLLLLLLLVAVGLSSGRMILADRRPLIHDPLTNLVPAVALARALDDGTGDAWRRWLHASWFRPPLAFPLYLPALALVPDKVQAIRLTDLALFLVLLWQVYALGRALGSRRAGLLAAWLVAAFPLVQGWSRMGTADPAIWLVLLVLLRILLFLNLDDRRQAVALGLCAGFCVGTRLLTLVYLVGPALWILIFRVRQRRSLQNLALAGLAALAPAGWWYLRQFDQVSSNLMQSSGGAQAPELTLLTYLQTGHAWVLAGALAGWLVAWRQRLIPRQQLLLLALWIGAPVLQFLLLWHVWERYPLALVPACALLVALAAERLSPRWLSLAARAALPVAALVPLLLIYSAGVCGLSSGLMWPDPRTHDAPLRALKEVPAGEPVLLVDELTEPDYARGILLASGRRDLPQLVDLPGSGRPFTMPPTTPVLYLLRMSPRCLRPDAPMCELYAPHRWWQEARVKLPLRSQALAHDPDGMEYELFKLPAPMTGRALMELR